MLFSLDEKSHQQEIVNVDELIKKLNGASAIQLFAILERVEKVSEVDINMALLAQKRR
ncbi:MAG: hypothetical protein K8F91_06500 [Candidatus Obscuribacterales bacterium]|nr:hypothetical protein [Candidatus Obscuribacterales bacterium]